MAPCLCSQTDQIGIPIIYKDITVSLSIPGKWGNRSFGVRRIPDNQETLMGRTNEYSIWRNDWVWNRSWFRGPLGKMICDASFKTRIFSEINESRSRSGSTVADFRDPSALLQYVKNVRSKADRSSFFEYDVIENGRGFWIRCCDAGKKIYGLPTAEVWFIGVSENAYIQLEFAVIRQTEDESGEKWQMSAIYWQNKIIETLNVSGLKQTNTLRLGHSKWQFPEALKKNEPLDQP